jgi:hypothetical protein
MYIGRLRPRMPRWFSSKGSVTARRRRIQVWGVNREVRTGVKRLESERLERTLERDAAIQVPSIRIDTEEQSGRLIEVALFLKGC